MKSIAFGTFAASLLIAADASAAGNHLGLDFGLFAESQNSESNTAFTPVLDGRFKLSEQTALDIKIPFTAVDAPNDDGMLVRLANPYVGLSWGFDIDLVELWVGAAVTLPTSRLPGGADDLAQAQNAFFSASASRGRYDHWLWEPEAMSLILPAELEVNLGLLEVRADAAWALLIPTGGADTETLAQLGAEGLLSLGLLSVGARAQTAWQPTADDGEKAQVSLGPVLELGVGPLEARAMFVFNLEGPVGTSFSDEAFWGVLLGAKVEF